MNSQRLEFSDSILMYSALQSRPFKKSSFFFSFIMRHSLDAIHGHIRLLLEKCWYKKHVIKTEKNLSIHM